MCNNQLRWHSILYLALEFKLTTSALATIPWLLSYTVYNFILIIIILIKLMNLTKLQDKSNCSQATVPDQPVLSLLNRFPGRQGPDQGRVRQARRGQWVGGPRRNGDRQVEGIPGRLRDSVVGTWNGFVGLVGPRRRRYERTSRLRRSTRRRWILGRTSGTILQTLYYETLVS